MIVEDIARIAHEAHRVYCESIKESGNFSWEDSSPDVRANTIELVICLLTHPSINARDLHDSWMIKMLEKGEEISLHPCLIPWDMLPANQKPKAEITTAIVRGLALHYTGGEL